MSLAGALPWTAREATPVREAAYHRWGHTGFYVSPWRSKRYPRIQLLTIADLFSNRPIDMPEQDIAENVTYRKGPKRERQRPTQTDLFKKGA